MTIPRFEKSSENLRKKYSRKDLEVSLKPIYICVTYMLSLITSCYTIRSINNKKGHQRIDCPFFNCSKVN